MEDLKQVTECLRILANQFNNTLVLAERDRILGLMEQLLKTEKAPDSLADKDIRKKTIRHIITVCRGMLGELPGGEAEEIRQRVRIEERRRFIGMLRGHFPDGFKGMSDLIPQILAGVADKGE